MKKHARFEEYCTEKGLCTGCGLCELMFGKDAVSVDLKTNGFYRPVFNSRLNKDQINRFTNICPALNMTGSNPNIYGNLESAFIGWSSDDSVRYKASSGGALSSFLIFLVESKIVDGVIHIGRDVDLLESKIKISRTKEEIIRNCGSLYMPSPTFKGLLDITKRGEKYAFVGKGCDIRGMKNYFAALERMPFSIVVYIGIMCGGIPSLEATKRILSNNSIDKDNLVSLSYRGNGWPGKFEASDEKNNIQMTYNEAWGKHLGPTSALACKICFDGIAEKADITFGDAWYCNDNNYPVFEETDGRNLILVRSKIGNDLLLMAREKEFITLSEEAVDSNTIKSMQPSQTNRRYLAYSKVLGLRSIGYKYPLVNLRTLKMIKKSYKVSIKTSIRTAVGTIKRALAAGRNERM